MEGILYRISSFFVRFVTITASNIGVIRFKIIFIGGFVMNYQRGYVDTLIAEWILDETMDQDDFDERLDKISIYFNGIYEGVDQYYLGIE